MALNTERSASERSHLTQAEGLEHSEVHMQYLLKLKTTSEHRREKAEQILEQQSATLSVLGATYTPRGDGQTPPLHDTCKPNDCVLSTDCLIYCEVATIDEILPMFCRYTTILSSTPSKEYTCCY